MSHGDEWMGAQFPGPMEITPEAILAHDAVLPPSIL